MYNPIQIALSRVYSKIPTRILELAFRRFSSISPIDQIVVDKIIHGKVLQDCSLTGGKIKEIPLLVSYHEDTVWGIPEATVAEGRFSLYRVPSNVRDNLAITAITHISYPANINANPMGVYSNFGNTMNDMVDQVLESHTFNNSRITPMAELLAGDLVRLIPGQSSHVDWVISARLAYEPNFSNLNQSAVLSFANLVVLATKAFIYNELIISLDEVSTTMGVEINTVKQIIESYAEADKEYDEMLTEQFTGGAQLDPRRMAILFNHML